MEKEPLFTVPERVEMLREVTQQWPGVEVDVFQGLLVDYVTRRHASVIVRGLRAVSDFEYEMQMALMNRHLRPGVETVFMMPAEQYTYVSSRLVKEVAALGGSVSGLVLAVFLVGIAIGSASGSMAVRGARNSKALLGWSQMLLGGAVALLPVYAKEILNTGPWGLGLLRSVQATGHDQQHSAH